MYRFKDTKPIRKQSHFRPWICFRGLLRFWVVNGILSIGKIYFVRWWFILFYPDVPIQTANDDVLERHSFAEQLAQAMIAYQSPEAFTIGLYGPWGSGKTSVINLLVEELHKQSDDCIVVQFNPWLCSNPEQMISQFFEQLKSTINALRSQENTVEDINNFAQTANEICSAFGKYAEALKWTRLVPGLNTLGTIFEMLGTGTEVYQKLVGKDDHPQSLQDYKNRIQTILEQQKQKIIVIIDDLDRLSSDEIIAVFQLVKSLADFPYMIYLLSFDRDVVVKSLADVQKGDGQAYLEKIIQMPFEMPRANKQDIEEVFWKRLGQIVQEQNHPIQQNFWEVLFDEGIGAYLLSIRDIIRYMNTFAFKYTMLKAETDLQDLILLTFLQVFEPEIFAQLPFHSDILCGAVTDFLVNEEAKKARIQKVYDALLKSASPNKKQAAEYLLSTLFPELARCKREFSTVSGYRYHSKQERMQHHCICCRECFDRYFALNLERDAIPDAVIQYIIFEADQDSFVQQIKEWIENRKIKRFLNELEAYFPSNQENTKFIPEERAKQLILWLSEQWALIEKIPSTIAFLSSSLRYTLLRIDFKLLGAMPPEIRCDVLKTIIASPKIAVGAVFDILGRLENLHNRFREEVHDYLDTIITLEEVKQLEDVFMERMLPSLQAATLLEDKDVKLAFWLMEEIDKERTNLAQIKAAVEEHLPNDAFLIQFIALHIDMDNSFGDVIWKINIDMIAQYVKMDEAAARVEHFLLSDAVQQMTDKEKQEMAAFLVAVDLKNRGEEKNVSDTMVDRKLNNLAIQ